MCSLFKMSKSDSAFPVFVAMLVITTTLVVLPKFKPMPNTQVWVVRTQNSLEVFEDKYDAQQKYREYARLLKIYRQEKSFPESDGDFETLCNWVDSTLQRDKSETLVLKRSPFYSSTRCSHKESHE